jgi:hypothetical protein
MILSRTAPGAIVAVVLLAAATGSAAQQPAVRLPTTGQQVRWRATDGTVRRGTVLETPEPGFTRFTYCPGFRTCTASDARSVDTVEVAAIESLEALVRSETDRGMLIGGAVGLLLGLSGAYDWIRYGDPSLSEIGLTVVSSTFLFASFGALIGKEFEVWQPIPIPRLE